MFQLVYCVRGSLKNLFHFEMGGLANAEVIGGSLNADRGKEGVKFAKILLTSYVNAPLLRISQSYNANFQATHDLIKSLHETSLMLQDRMALSEMETQRKRLFQDYTRPTSSRSRRSETVSADSRMSELQSGARASFVRSPTKRGVRVSARFKRMTPSPAKFISPCRKGIRGLRIALPSPLASGHSPSQNVTFDQSPGTTLKRSSESGAQSPTKKTCTESAEKADEKGACPDEKSASPENYKESSRDSGHATSKEDSDAASKEGSAKVKPRRRSDIAKRVSMRLKHVYGKSPVRPKVPRRQVVSNDGAVSG